MELDEDLRDGRNGVDLRSGVGRKERTRGTKLDKRNVREGWTEGTEMDLRNGLEGAN